MERNKENYKKKLKSDGKMSKKEQLDKLREKIKNLQAKELLNKEISEYLDIPIKSLERHITYMRKKWVIVIVYFFIHFVRSDYTLFIY